MTQNRLFGLQRGLTKIDKQGSSARAQSVENVRKKYRDIQNSIRAEIEQERLTALLALEEKERRLREAQERRRLEEEQKREHERREHIRNNPQPIKPRRFKDKRVTILYALFLDCFPEGGGFTRDGHWVDENLSERARLVLSPCFEGEPERDPLGRQILKLIAPDTGDSRLTVEERTAIFQLFYRSCVETRKPQSNQEDTICL